MPDTDENIIPLAASPKAGYGPFTPITVTGKSLPNDAQRLQPAIPAPAVTSGELAHVTRQLDTLAEAGLPIPQHLQEYLKQHGPTICAELIALRRAVKARGLA